MSASGGRGSAAMLWVGLVLGSACGFWFGQYWSGAASASKLGTIVDGKVVRAVQVPGTFFLGVAVTFATPADKIAFVEIFKPLSDYVRDFEIGTLGYKLMESDKDSLRVFILERYKDKENDFVRAHRSSEAFKTFRAQMQKMQEEKKITVVAGESYIERSDLGFA